MYPLNEHKHFCSTMKCRLPPVGGVESQGSTANMQVAASPGAWKAKGCSANKPVHTHPALTCAGQGNPDHCVAPGIFQEWSDRPSI